MLSGIAGVIYPDFFHAERMIEPMLDCLQHRSARGTEFHTYKNIQLGICGRKIATNDKKTLMVGLDGTIYNGEMLRNELRKLGYQTPLEACSEIILAAYEHWGIDCLDRISGDFAMFIFDQEEKKIVLARDRIGKKPLYWYHENNLFLFGSELKALLATGAIPQNAAKDALASYLFFGYVPQDMTPIQNVNKLLPSFYLEIGFDQTKNIQPYWSYSSYFVTHPSVHRQTIVEQLDTIIDASIKERLKEGGASGCLMQGGIGSGSVAFYMSKHNPPENIEAYSVAFQNESEKDQKAAKIAMETLGLRENCATITPSTFFDDLVKIAWHLDEPIADPNIVATWQLAKMGSAKSETVFSGMGSDEMLAGHNRYKEKEHPISFWQRIKRNALPFFAHALVPLFKKIYQPYALKLLKLGKSSPWQYTYLEQNALFNESQMRKVSPKLAEIFDSETFLSKFYHLPRESSHIASFLYFDVKTRLADCYIHQYERLTAAHRLQWRAPYLDRHLIEYLASIPEPTTLEEQEPSYYLKSILKKVFPREYVYRPKVERPHFLQKWIDHPEILEIFNLLREGTLVETGMISGEWIAEQLNHPKDRSNRFRSLFAILMLEIWFRLYINHPIQTRAPNIGLKELLTET